MPTNLFVYFSATLARLTVVAEERKMSYHIGGIDRSRWVEVSSVEELLDSGLPAFVEVGNHAGSTLYRVKDGEVFFECSEYLGAQREDTPSIHPEGKLEEFVTQTVAGWPGPWDTDFIEFIIYDDEGGKEVTLCQ